MSKVLVVAEHADSVLDDVTRELVTAARDLGDQITLGVAASNPKALVEQATIGGVDQIVTVQIDTGDASDECQHAAVRAMIEHVTPDAIVMAFIPRVTSYAAALAEELGLGFASDVVSARRDDRGDVVAARPVYEGKVLAELGFPEGRTPVLLLRPLVWAPAGEQDLPPVIELDVRIPVPRVRRVQVLEPSAEGVDLTQADLVLAVGRGVGEKDKIAVFANVAERMGAALGASRPLVDAGWLPPHHQIGQSGVAVKPRVYLAFGISGALQHLVGISGAKTIVAVNTDGNAPIFDVADIGSSADMFEVAEELSKLLDAAGA